MFFFFFLMGKANWIIFQNPALIAYLPYIILQIAGEYYNLDISLVLKIVMIHGLVLRKAPIFLSKSAVWLAFLSTQDYCPRETCVSKPMQLDEEASLDIVWILGSSWRHIVSCFCCSFIFVPFSDRIEKELLSKFYVLLRT